MSTPTEPDFMDCIIVDENGWHLREDSPDHIKKQYEEWEKENLMYKEVSTEQWILLFYGHLRGDAMKKK